MQKRLWWVPVLAVGAFVVIGCGDDSGTSKPKPDGGSKDSGPPPADVDAGQDSGPGGGTGGSTPPASVKCGKATCPAYVDMTGMNPMPPVACCVDEAAGTCGLTPMAGGTCEPAAIPDTSCPSITLLGMPSPAGSPGFGCCVAGNKCGVDGSGLGRGCVENAEAAAGVAASPLAMFVMVPDPQACGETDGGDAGN